MRVFGFFGGILWGVWSPGLCRTEIFDRADEPILGVRYHDMACDCRVCGFEVVARSAAYRTPYAFPTGSRGSAAHQSRVGKFKKIDMGIRQSDTVE